MKYMGVNELREAFLKFFEGKGHLKLDSFSLIPQNDNSLLLINSGMAPLKPYFTGLQIPPRKRVTTCQKCVRTGDIENVGKTARHGTFFEMLGNFSFGDYFKKEAIPWSWEFFTEVLKLPVDRLYVSVYQDDDEAYDIWHKTIGLPENKIFRMGREDNFWEHGIGPCGPCSEIYYDKGEQYGCGSPDCTVGCDCDRYMEIWNLVFTQFNKEEDGSYSNLSHPNIDTGMGLERIATVMQNVDSIFEVDTIREVMNNVCRLSGKEYNKDYKTDVSLRVITDHIRSVTFMTADGILPSNEGRGYVLRRLLRRAARHGKTLGIDKKFLAELSRIVIEQSKDAYPQLAEKSEYIYKILTIEEERFYTTLDHGIELLKKKIQEINQSNDKKMLSTEDSFKMYDTYGFPVELMKEILEEQGISIDEDAFFKAMEKQRARARDARGESTYMGADETVYHKLAPEISTVFTGYDNYSENTARTLAVIVNETICESASEGDEVCLVFDKTPFYAEMGGQIGDCGKITGENFEIEIENCIKFGDNKFIHIGTVKSGIIKLGDTAKLEIDIEKRLAIARNHTATHLLQKALRETLGSHVEQAGSLVSDRRLRFDFTHFEPISREDLTRIERIVNEHILAAHDVVIKEMSMDEARKSGAMALFDEKYGDIVRVVNIGDYSIELCGGTHLKNSSQTGMFKILSENGIAAGVRRIEAVTGYGALNFYEERDYILSAVRDELKASPTNMVSKINALIDENKRLTQELQKLKSEQSSSLVDDIINNSRDINGINVVCAKTDNLEVSELRDLGDRLKARLGKCAVLLLTANDSKVTFIAMADDETVKAGFDAGAVVKAAAIVCGGGGGGRKNMAQAGGKDASKADEALETGLKVIETQLS